ncbi:hypothetical protein FRC08_001210 [Ceratobasidium sp. 394]|nr:hypothetical protein FRC08_001210 [Ceratobasidium sp. 394]
MLAEHQENPGALPRTKLHLGFSQSIMCSPLIEKTYAKMVGDFSAVSGGFAAEGIKDLTGGVATKLEVADILDADAF